MMIDGIEVKINFIFFKERILCGIKVMLKMF